MKVTVLALVAVLVFAVAAVAQPRDPELNDSEEPGSFLVFHKFLRGAVTVNGFPEPRSAFEISVTCPRDVTTGAPGVCLTPTSVRIKLHWICPGEKFGDDTCRSVDFFLTTTVYGTLWFNPDNVGDLGESRFQTVARPPGPANPKNVNHCPEGFLVAYVVNTGGQPIKFDALIGDAVLRHHAAAASAYNALPIQARADAATGEVLQTGGAPLNFGSANAGSVHYKAITGKIWGPIRLDRPDSRVTGQGAIETSLTFLTLDVLAGRQNPPTIVEFNVYNQDEVANSGSLEFVCFVQVRLSDLGGFDTSFGRKGLIETTVAENANTGQPVTLLAIVHTIERSGTFTGTYMYPIAREYAYSLYHDSTPVPTTFDP